MGTAWGSFQEILLHIITWLASFRLCQEWNYHIGSVAGREGHHEMKSLQISNYLIDSLSLKSKAHSVNLNFHALSGQMYRWYADVSVVNAVEERWINGYLDFLCGDPLLAPSLWGVVKCQLTGANPCWTWGLGIFLFYCTGIMLWFSTDAYQFEQF